MYELTLSDQAQVTLQLRGGLSDLRYRFLVNPPLLEGGGAKKFFTGARNRCLRSWNTFLRALEVAAWAVRGRYEHNKM